MPQNKNSGVYHNISFTHCLDMSIYKHEFSTIKHLNNKKLLVFFLCLKSGLLSTDYCSLIFSRKIIFSSQGLRGVLRISAKKPTTSQMGLHHSKTDMCLILILGYRSLCKLHSQITLVGPLALAYIGLRAQKGGYQ